MEDQIKRLEDEIAALRKKIAEFDKSVWHLVDLHNGGAISSLEMATNIVKQGYETGAIEAEKRLIRLIDLQIEVSRFKAHTSGEYVIRNIIASVLDNK